jgi:DNA-binding transcriptional LysR family regulator
VRTLREDDERSVALPDLRPGEPGQSLEDRSVDIAFASASGIDTPGLGYADLRASKVQLFVVDGHPPAAAGRVKLEDFDGHRLLAASRAGTPHTDLLVGPFADAGATVTPPEARVSGGAQLLTELNDAGTVAAMPAGTRPPQGLIALDVECFLMPLLALWRSERAPEAVARLRERLGAEGQTCR